jgi:hypothetical protein
MGDSAAVVYYGLTARYHTLTYSVRRYRTVPATASSRQPDRQPRSIAETGLRIVSAQQKPAREKAVQPARDEYAINYSECRSLGHSWRHAGWVGPDARRPLGQYNTYAYVSICAHCNTRRTKWVSRYGNRGQVTYEYPEGYARRGDERLSLQQWRRTWIVAMLGDDA